LDVQPKQLLETRTNNKGELEVLIKWQHLPNSENSWEACSPISKEFPDFHLKDKVKLHGRGIDRFGIVYNRRKRKT